MKNGLRAILMFIMLLVAVGTVSCETVNNGLPKDTTNNQNQDANKGNEIAKGDNKAPKENNVVKESLEDNKIDDKVPNINEEPTKVPPVEENMPIVDNTTPEVKEDTPIIENKTPVIEDKVPTVEEKAPTIDNNTSIINKPTEGASEYQFMAEVEQMVFIKVNEERSKVGVSALTYNVTMEKYARIKSQDMGDRGYFSHNDPEGRLITEDMRGDGVTYKTWGENIAYISGVSDANALANQFMTNWMNSQGHRENILSTNFSSIGVGIYKIGSKVYATQEFYR